MEDCCIWCGVELEDGKSGYCSPECFERDTETDYDPWEAAQDEKDDPFAEPLDYYGWDIPWELER